VCKLILVIRMIMMMVVVMMIRNSACRLQRESSHLHVAESRQGLTELRVVVTVAGGWGNRLTSHVVSSRFVRTRHERSKQ